MPTKENSTVGRVVMFRTQVAPQNNDVNPLSCYAIPSEIFGVPEDYNGILCIKLRTFHHEKIVYFTWEEFVKEAKVAIQLSEKSALKLANKIWTKYEKHSTMSSSKFMNNYFKEYLILTLAAVNSCRKDESSGWALTKDNFISSFVYRATGQLFTKEEWTVKP